MLAVTHSQKVADSGTRIVRMEEGRVADDIQLRERSCAINEPDRATSRSLGLLASFRMALQNMKLNMKRNVLVALGGSIGILCASHVVPR